MKSKLKIAGLAILLCLSQSCSVLNPKGEILTIKAKWDRQLNIQPMDDVDNKVFLKCKNSSGSEVGQLVKAAIKKAVLDEGYLTTTKNKDAAITVRADVNYFGESQGDPVYYGKVLGAVGGGTIGAVAGGKNRKAAAVGGAVIGAGIGHLIDMAGRTDKYGLVATVTVWQNNKMTKAVLVCSAEKRNLTEDEAAAKLVRRMSIAISNILP